MSVCVICDGVGLMRVVNGGGQWVFRAGHIPELFRHYISDGYETAFCGTDAPLGVAYITARRFARECSADSVGKGLLFEGSKGVGKAHLAVSVLNPLSKVVKITIPFVACKITCKFSVFGLFPRCLAVPQRPVSY